MPALFAAYGDRRIIDRSQHILADISDLRGVLLEAIHHIADVFGIQLHKPAANDLCRTILCGNTNHRFLAADRFNDQIQNVIQQVRIVRIILLQLADIEML